MVKAKDAVGSVTQKVYDLLKPLGPDWHKVVNAVSILLGGKGSPAGGAAAGAADETGNTGTAAAASEYFAAKSPRGKIESLAVAARYREEHEGAETHSKEDFAKFFKAARHNFDSKNFSADINNAKIKGLFNRGSGNPLSYNGQKYVDALPDRKRAKTVVKAARRGKGRKKKVTKS